MKFRPGGDSEIAGNGFSPRQAPARQLTVRKSIFWRDAKKCTDEYCMIFCNRRLKLSDQEDSQRRCADLIGAERKGEMPVEQKRTKEVRFVEAFIRCLMVSLVERSCLKMEAAQADLGEDHLM